MPKSLESGKKTLLIDYASCRVKSKPNPTSVCLNLKRKQLTGGYLGNNSLDVVHHAEHFSVI